MKRKNGADSAAAKPAGAKAGDGVEDVIVATPRHHLLDEFAARPRLRKRPPDNTLPPIREE